MHPTRYPHRSAGVALVIILFIIVLVVGLVVAFLNMVNTERVSSANYLASSEARQLADTAVGIVQSQINYATSRGTKFAWASQPGMIRTYAESGAFDTAYKLYSSSILTTNSISAIGGDLPPENWAASPAIWTDINSPVTTGEIRTFPIFDPSAALDTNEEARVKGITIATAPGATATQPAPMPVRWLYILQNGEIRSPADGTTGSSVTIADATAANPIIGRIAFWTDDDTSKINVNTAGVGSYWDTPHFNTTEERNFAKSQPLNGEFQRYPGHPAMTDLRAVFPTLSARDILDKITPRYQWGGSEQGTIDTYSMTDALASGQVAKKPLLASIDEIKFISDQDDRQSNPQLDRAILQKAKFFLTATSRSPELNLFDLPRIACWPISTNSIGRSTFDKVIAFCSTISGKPYYFQRQASASPTTDANIERNMQLFSYLQHLASNDIPGFGVQLASKWENDTNQILVEIWDYIRSTNLYDSRLPSGTSFTSDPPATGTGMTPGHGYVVPLEMTVSGDTLRGFGRSYTLSELAFQFICTADSVDIPSSGGTLNPKGLRGSNDTVKNRTLNGTALDPVEKERRIQMMIIPELFSPSLGNVLIAHNYLRLKISGLSTLQLNSQPLFTVNEATIEVPQLKGITHSRRAGGAFDYRALLWDAGNPRRSPLPWDGGGGIYQFISNPVTVKVSGSPTDPGSMAFSSGTLNVVFESSSDGASWSPIQTIEITPPSTGIPIPNLVLTGGMASENAPATDAAHWWAFSLLSPMTDGTSGGRLSGVQAAPNDWRFTSGLPSPTNLSGAGTEIKSGSLIRGSATGDPAYTDVVRSMVPSHGDYRLIAALKSVPADAFSPLGNWSTTGGQNALIHTLGSGAQTAGHVAGGAKWRRHPITADPIGSTAATTFGAGGNYAPDFRRDASAALLNAIVDRGDFDNPPANWPDGAYINKPDEGNIWSASTGSTPYFIPEDRGAIDSRAFFSPNRMISGPGMFGSLSTYVRRYASNLSKSDEYAWRTLLFRKTTTHPDRAVINSGLPNTAPDHLIMDFFWMPTVEPYAISEPFATAGKINMNYQIQPFTYLQRKTALIALLQNEKIPAIPNTANASYKSGMNATPVASSYREQLDVMATLTQFDNRFTEASITGRIFVSPTELCDMWLVPTGRQPTDSSMEDFWSSHRLTGDNLREKPYARLIPRLTTKSNTYTVHFRVQRLKSSNPSTWDDGKNLITGEYRGSTTIERFLDPNATYPDYAQNPSAQPELSSFYRWRTVENRMFSP